MAASSLGEAKPSAAQRRRWGKEARERASRKSFADWQPPADRPDPVQWMRATNEGRLPQFVGFRGSRMAASPFGFLRGAADLMAIDLVATKGSGLLTTAVGDAHLGNFGFYGSAERNLVVDVNDFDQAHPGPWEWDLLRLAASIVVAGRGNGLSDRMTAEAVRRAVARYAFAVDRVAGLGVMAFNEEVITVERLQSLLRRTSLAKETAAAEKKARERTQEATVPRFAGPESGGRVGIIEQPPLLVVLQQDNAAVVGATRDSVVAALDGYVASLPYEWQRVVEYYSVLDVAYRVSGVGSAGMRTYMVLLAGDTPGDYLLLQLKQAAPSVLAGRVDAPASRFRHEGERVVRSMQRGQNVSDPLLGWTTMDGRDFYVRQLRDMKGAVPIEDLDASQLDVYGQMCGALLARAHARSGDPAAISGYVGKGSVLGQSLARFAVKYADQTEQDWQAVRAAALAGEIPYTEEPEG